MAERLAKYVRQHHLGLLCLFLIVGGGTAWALERNTVKSKHIVNGQVKDSDLAPGIPSEVEVVNNFGGNTSVDKSVEVECPEGKVAIGGGAVAPTGGATGFVALTASQPTTGPEGWRGSAIEVNGGSAQTWGIGVYAICARP